MNSDSPIHHSDSPTWRVGESPTIRLSEFSFKHSRLSKCESRRLPHLPSRRVANSPSRGFVFRLWISPQIWSQNRNSSKGSVRDLWGTISAKTPENPPHCHVPLNLFNVYVGTNVQFCLCSSATSVLLASTTVMRRLQWGRRPHALAPLTLSPAS